MNDSTLIRLYRGEVPCRELFLRRWLVDGLWMGLVWGIFAAGLSFLLAGEQTVFGRGQQVYLVFRLLLPWFILLHTLLLLVPMGSVLLRTYAMGRALLTMLAPVLVLGIALWFVLENNILTWTLAATCPRGAGKCFAFSGILLAPHVLWLLWMVLRKRS